MRGRGEERCGTCVASFQGVQGDEREKHEVAGRVAAAGCGTGTHLLGRGGEDDRGGGGLGRAGQLGWPGRTVLGQLGRQMGWR